MTEVPGPDAQQRHRAFQLPGLGASHEERYYLIVSRRLGAQKLHTGGSAAPDLRFAVWAPRRRQRRGRLRTL